MGDYKYILLIKVNHERIVGYDTMCIGSRSIKTLKQFKDDYRVELLDLIPSISDEGDGKYSWEKFMKNKMSPIKLGEFSAVIEQGHFKALRSLQNSMHIIRDVLKKQKKFSEKIKDGYKILKKKHKDSKYADYEVLEPSTNDDTIDLLIMKLLQGWNIFIMQTGMYDVY